MNVSERKFIDLIYIDLVTVVSRKYFFVNIQSSYFKGNAITQLQFKLSDKAKGKMWQVIIYEILEILITVISKPVYNRRVELLLLKEWYLSKPVSSEN